MSGQTITCEGCGCCFTTETPNWESHKHGCHHPARQKRVRREHKAHLASQKAHERAMILIDLTCNGHFTTEQAEALVTAIEAIMERAE